MSLGRLVLEFMADTAKFQSDVGRAAHLFERTVGGMQRAIRGLALSLGATITVGGLVAMVRNTSQLADELAKTSQRVGVSVESLTALRYSADLAGASAEELTTGLRMLAKNAADMQMGTGEAIYAFAALGMQAEDMHGQLKPTEQLFMEIADQFAAMEDGAGKTAIAMKIFGRSGAQLIPLLNQGSAGLKANADEAARFGIIISTETAKAAERFNDDLNRLSRQLEAVRISIFSDLIGPLADVAHNFVEATKAAEGFWQALVLGSRGAPKDLGSLMQQIENERGAIRELEKEVDDWARARLLGLEKLGGTQAMSQLRQAEARLKMLKSLAEQAQKTGTEGAFAFDVPGGTGKKPPPKLLDPRKAEAEAKKAADAIIKLIDNRAKIQLEIEKSLSERQMEILELQHSENLISEEEYWNAKFKLQQRAFENEAAILDEQIARQQEAVNKAKVGTADYAKELMELETLQAKRNQLEADFGHKAEMGGYAAQKAAREYAKVIEGINIRLLEAEGKRTEAARRRLAMEGEQERRRFANDPATLAKIARLEELQLAEVQISEERDKSAAITARLGIEEERIQNARRVGAISELEALAQTENARRAAVAQLEAIVEAQEAVAEASKSETLKLQAEQSRASLERLRSEMDLVADKINTVFEDAFGDAFADFIMGTKSAEEAFKDFAKTVISELARMYAKMIATQIFGGGGQGGGGIGGWLAGLIGSGAGSAGASSVGTGYPMVTGAGMMASGGRASAGMPYIVGEVGPELFVPDMSGTVVPNGQWGGGDTYYIDASGADAAAIKRLESTIRALNGSIERRAVLAVTGARRRGLMPSV